MLSTEKQFQVKGITLYQDLQDESKYYYLPSDEVKIADGGKKLHFLAYIDGDVKEGTTPSFEEDKNSGGFLTLEVELGPDENALSGIKTELESLVNKTDIKLVPVPLKGGDVRLVMFGSDGKDDSVKVNIAGSVKPSLIGRQSAVFSIRLGGREAQIVWDLLHKTTQTQIAVMYDLTFLGVMPAHHLEITVDYSQVEKYINHHFNADLDFSIDNKPEEGKDGDKGSDESAEEGKDTKINYSAGLMADIEVDTVFHDLVSDGAITIKHTDYTEDGAGSPLPETDASGMELVKQLLSTELFKVEPLPTGDFGGSKASDAKPEDGKTAGDKAGELAGKVADAAAKAGKEGDKSKTDDKTAKTDASVKTEGQAPVKPKAEDDDDDETKKKAAIEAAKEAAKKKAEETFKEFEQLKHAHPEYITKEEWKENKLPEADFTGDLVEKVVVEKDGKKVDTEVVKKEKYAEYRKKKIDEAVSAAEKEASKPKKPADDKKDDGSKKKSSVKTINIKGNLKVGYSYKKRELSEQIKRTYVFDKQHAQTFEYHPNGIISNDLSSDKKLGQSVLVRLGEGEFKNVEVKFSSGIDFDKYHIKEILVEFTHAPSEDTVLNKAFSLTKEKQSATYNFVSDAFAKGTKGMDVTVAFIFDGGAKFLGYKSVPASFKTTRTNVTEKSIVIDTGFLEDVVPVEIETGSIRLAGEGISAAVYIEKLEEDKTVLLGEFPVSAQEGSRIVLLNPDGVYRKKLVYTFAGKKYDGTPCTSKTLSVINPSAAAFSDVVVDEPDKGLIKFRTYSGENTFDGDILGISLTLKQGEKSLPAVNLSKSSPEVYLVVNSESEDFQPIQVESVTVFRRNAAGAVEGVKEPVSQTEIGPDDSEYMVLVF